ncbi:MAG TPA: hypothetical protein VJO33_02420 [Gemmatimonadaceae bacterium]|nr:hypothetical protein [Gemmatimonadaceae bacterium]
MAAVKRKRGVPVQVYFTARERLELGRIARKRSLSVAALVRGWIRRAAAAERARAPKPVRVDPRQTTIAACS